MKYGEVAGLDKPVSRIILGGSGNGMRRGENCDGILDAAFEAGINTFDTARGYGKSERVLGGWINRRGLRDKVIVITKGALHGLLGNNRVNESCIRSDLKKSLETLDCGFADIYLLHRDNVKTPAGVFVELLNEFQSKGYIKLFGVSNWTYQRIQEANEYAYKRGLNAISVSEPHYSLAVAGRWTWIGCTSVTGAAHESERQWYKTEALPLFAFSPLGGGFLSGTVKSVDINGTAKTISHAMRTTFVSEENAARLRRCEEVAQQSGYTVAQIALAWVLQSGLNSFVITGGSRPQTIQKSAAAAEITLTAEQLTYLGN